MLVVRKHCILQPEWSQKFSELPNMALVHFPANLKTVHSTWGTEIPGLILQVNWEHWFLAGSSWISYTLTLTCAPDELQGHCWVCGETSCNCKPLYMRTAAVNLRYEVTKPKFFKCTYISLQADLMHYYQLISIWSIKMTANMQN